MASGQHIKLKWLECDAASHVGIIHRIGCIEVIPDPHDHGWQGRYWPFENGNTTIFSTSDSRFVRVTPTTDFDTWGETAEACKAAAECVVNDWVEERKRPLGNDPERPSALQRPTNATKRSPCVDVSEFSAGGKLKSEAALASSVRWNRLDRLRRAARVNGHPAK